MSSYLIIGGSGRTGRRVVERLQAAGHGVSVLSRRPRPVDGVSALRGDLRHPAAWSAALDEVSGVVVCVEPPYDASGAEAVMHRGVADLAANAASRGVRVVLVSQIYVTRPLAQPAMAPVTEARWRGEQALRASGAAYAVVRPGWMTDDSGTGFRLDQGDRGDGTTSRDLVADACVQLLLRPLDHPVTFEVFDDPAADRNWPTALAALTPDTAMSLR